MLDLAIRAAREAGAIIQDFAARRFDIIHKGRINLVTEADLASEKHIKELITAYYPTLSPRAALQRLCFYSSIQIIGIK